MQHFFFNHQKAAFMNRFWLCLFLAFTSTSLFGQAFVEEAAFRGVHCTYGSNQTFGGGISAYDFTGDGLDDLTIATEAGKEILFYRNDGQGFTQVFHPGISDQFQTKQVLWIDFDNDNDLDLFASSALGENVLYVNDGFFSFSKLVFTKSAAFPDATIASYGATFADLDNDGFLDLFITHYDNRVGVPNQLFINDGAGSFIEMTATSALSGKFQRTFCSSIIDYDGDLRPDIYTAEDRATINRLYHNANGVLADSSSESATDVVVNAMGIAIGDYDMDGDLDIYVSNTPEGNPMLRNNGDGSFTRVDSLIFVSYNRVAWGVNFLDYDNDMDLDLYVSGSTDIDRVQSQLFGNNGLGIFQGYSGDSLLGDSTFSFANAIGDFNNDGYPDLVVNNKGPDSLMLWRNLRSGNNWLKVKAIGTTSNRDAIGTRIEVYVAGQVLLRYKGNATGFVSQNSGSEMFGLGSNLMVDSIVVKWPSGTIDRLTAVVANQSIVVTEGGTANGNLVADAAAIKVWPQPAHSKLNIELPRSSGVVQIVLCDLNGKELLRKAITGSADSLQLDCTGIPSGLYLLRMHSESEFHLQKVLIVQE